jgi:U4/U6 small nuclear ribonucleoprotein PRP31
VLDPLAYSRVVARIGNEESVIDIDFEDIIPRHVQMTVSVSASTTDGQPLTESDLRRVMDACALMEQLYADRDKLTRFVGSRMALVAPNLSAVCGANVAAKLVGAAGGLERLSEIPACNIQVLGQRKKISAGLSTRNVGLHQGYVFSCPLVTSIPPDYQQKGAKLIANKVALLARYDAFGNSGKRNGEQGAKMKVEIEKVLEKRMEPPPAPIAKPLPAPDGVSKKRRGGRRWRKQKERAATTEMMKQANRMQFGTVEEEYLNGDEMYGLGMLGKDGHGKLKVMQAASKLSKKGRALQKNVGSGSSAKGSAGGLLSGTQSSLAFSSVQGIELENPDREHVEHADVGGTRTSGTESYFSELSGFKTFRRIV